MGADPYFRWIEDHFWIAKTYQMDAYDHPRINFPSLDINRISFVIRAITKLSSTQSPILVLNKFEFYSSAHIPFSFLTSSIMSDRAQNRYKQFEISNLTCTWTCQHDHHQHNNQISTNLYSLFQIYIQLCKQCSENPRRESLRRGYLTHIASLPSLQTLF